jgi:hypothetical protein
MASMASMASTSTMTTINLQEIHTELESNGMQPHIEDWMIEGGRLKTNLYVETDRNKILEQIKLNAIEKGIYKTMAHKLELTLANFDKMYKFGELKSGKMMRGGGCEGKTETINKVSNRLLIGLLLMIPIIMVGVDFLIGWTGFNLILTFLSMIAGVFSVVAAKLASIAYYLYQFIQTKIIPLMIMPFTNPTDSAALGFVILSFIWLLNPATLNKIPDRDTAYDSVCTFIEKINASDPKGYFSDILARGSEQSRVIFNSIYINFGEKYNSAKDVICDYIHIMVNSRLIRALGVSANNILGILYNILDLLKSSYSNTRDLVEIIANGGIEYNIDELTLHMGGGNIYNFIINPKTNRRVNIYSKLGQKIISNYERKLLQ